MKNEELNIPESWRSHLPEFGTGLILLLTALGAWVFIRVADSAMDGATRGFDEGILLALRNPQDSSLPAGPEWLQVVVRDITALGGFFNLTLLTIAVVIYLSLINKARLALFVAVAVGGGALLNTVLKNLIERPRPDLVPHGTEAALSSFPSGHAMMSTVVFLTLGTLLAYATDDVRLKVFYLASAVLLAFVVGLSRIYLGVHWPTDILAGWVAGATWALICMAVAK
jgi:undecaprenyl-diphosphatase